MRAVVSTIGGDDSIRLLPYLDLDLIRAHPKALLGFSDTTVALTVFLRAGVVSFYGPSLMTDLAEHGGIRPFVKRAIRRALFESQPFELEAAETWTEEFADWGDPVARNRVRQFEPNEGWVWLQGDTRVEGRLIGGCAEVLETLKGTPGWPAPELWDRAVLVLETSELVPSPTWVGAWLRNYGAQGILQQLSALLIGRPYRYTPEMRGALYDQIRAVLAEFARSDLPVVANMDFGHTSPQMVLPLGCRAAVDPVVRRIEILEAPTAES